MGLRKETSISIANTRYLILSFLFSHIKKMARTSVRVHKSLKVLDVGCGSKPYRPFFENVGLYLGIDIARNSRAVDVLGMAEDLPFTENCFDITICTQVLEHAIYPEKVLDEIHRVMRMKGKVILSTHGMWAEGHEIPDMWRWTADGLRRILRLSGFQVQEVHSMDFIESLFQLMLMCLPSTQVVKCIVAPCINAVAKVLSRFKARLLRSQGPKLHVVHILLASKVGANAHAKQDYCF